MFYLLLLFPAILLLSGCASVDRTAEYEKCMVENKTDIAACEKPARTPSYFDRPGRFNRI